MASKECIAMILAGGQGSRLGVLTKSLAKPAVPFGGKYRIIDFTLSNCYNSGFDTVGVLTQYQPFALHKYIGIGSAWDLDRKTGGVFILPPFVRARGGEWYKGTANAIYQNGNFIDQFQPDHVLVLSGDHIYKMDYSFMLDFHKKQSAEATIAVIEVPWEEASRFGIMNTTPEGRIAEFEEKPKKPKNNLASMGVYIFNWKLLKRYLEEDDQDKNSSHDFGKNVIPKMLKGGQRLFAYPFRGYWKDVGTIESLWEANMDLLNSSPALDLHDYSWRVYAVTPALPPHFVAATAKVQRSLVGEGCQIYGEVDHCVIFPGVFIGGGTKLRDCVIMPDVNIASDCRIERAIIGQQARIENDCYISPPQDNPAGVAVVGEDSIVPAGSRMASAVVDLQHG